LFFSGKKYYTYDYESFDTDKNEYEKNGVVERWGQGSQLTYAVNYLIENKKGRVLANPRVLLTSGQSSTIDLTSDYVSKVTTQYLDSGSSSGSAQVQREYEISNDNGIKVTITPFISPDGYVTLDIKPEYKTIASQVYTTGETGEQELAATLLQRRDLDLKGVRIKDGETLVIGGLIQETEAKTVSKIPFLGDIPVIGMLFRSTGTTKEKSEMVIMLTPQIVIDTEDAVADDNML
jgi:type IV pilus assembly protein PilQ